MNEIFHISDCGDIKTFTPQAFWHVNYIWSGRVKPDKPIPDGAIIVHVVYADTSDKIPFYYLPRLTPRIWLTEAVSGRNVGAVRDLLDTSGAYRALLVPAEAEQSIRSHQFYKYSFEPSDFALLPSGEWVCYRPVEPTAVTGPHSAADSLEADGVKLIFCADLRAMKKRLDDDSIVHHCEKV
ncbi:hypothetical protein BH10PLA1_BH10PLA1_01320 [soil metagenome]